MSLKVSSVRCIVVRRKLKPSTKGPIYGHAERRCDAHGGRVARGRGGRAGYHVAEGQWCSVKNALEVCGKLGSDEATLTADEWLAGGEAEPATMSLKVSGVRGL
ncbi:unnamed protein product [Plutella xylostella]|uniref:(diamondback moth) hypothetical protein n=1 Tax=Plutella xylostella TaxID=51655 RepID=A0A8S4FDJ3_PLUXY|nr:unnamed protein product [Plutella xylostella]